MKIVNFFSTNFQIHADENLFFPQTSVLLFLREMLFYRNDDINDTY